jgi:hypothetical protein
VKAWQVLWRNNTPLGEVTNNGTYPCMNDQLGSDKDRKCNEESDVHFNVVKEGELTEVPSRGAESG